MVMLTGGRGAAQRQVRMEMCSAPEPNAELARRHQPCPQNKKKKQTCLNEGDCKVVDGRKYSFLMEPFMLLRLYFIVVKPFCWSVQNTNLLTPTSSLQLKDESIVFRRNIVDK